MYNNGKLNEGVGLKNIGKRAIVRKAEIYNEYRATYELSLLIGNENQIDALRQEMDHYDESVFVSHPTSKEKDLYKKEKDQLLPLSKFSAELISKGIDFDNPIILNYNKEGLKESVNQKADIKIIDPDTKKELAISLKQYQNYSDIQVASGTYFSTLCGLLFDTIGRGKFVTSSGEEFNSKKAQFSTIKRHVCEEYGAECAKPLGEILEITEEVHKLRYEESCPDAKVFKDLSKKSINPFLSLMSIAIKDKHSLIKNRFLKRTGFVGKKELVYTAYSGNSICYISSLTDDGFHEMIDSLNSEDCKLEVHQSGKNQDGQGVQFSFKHGNDVVLGATMPLSINKNGAWANRDRYCKVSKQYVNEGERRPKKALQLDTSTNVWVSLRKYIKKVS